MAIRADRVGVRQDQVDIHGRVTSPSFLNELLDDLPEWTDMPVWVNGTEELLPSNNSVPVTSPILADIAYPDIRRDNQYFTYRESPTPVDGLAKIKSIKGNTLVWNQIAENGNFDSVEGWGGNNSSITVANNVLTGTVVTSHATAGLRKLGGVSFIANHKYLVSAVMSCSVASDYCVARFYATGYDFRTDALTIRANTKKRQVWILTPTSSFTGDAYIYPKYSYPEPLAVGDTFTFEDVMLIDLSKMFGIGNEPTVNEFLSLFSLLYYDFNAGSLLSFNGTGLKTIGFNQWDEEWESGIYNVTTGVKQSGTRVRSKNFIRVLPNTPYYMNIACNRYYYDGNFNYIGYKSVFTENTADTTPPNCAYMTFNTFDAYGQTYKNDIVLSFESGTYEPYTSHTTNLPIATYFPTGMKSAGSVYDELTPRKAITRIGAVDLGSLTWSYQSGNVRFNANQALSGLAKLPSINNEVANIICAKYNTVSSNGTALESNNLSVGLSTNGNIQIRDTNFTDAVAFKESLQGEYLYYELATPVELPTMSFE